MDISKYKWLLFDLDNTLMDFHEPSVLSFFDLCQNIGLMPNKATYKTYKIENNKVWAQYEDGTITSQELRTLRFEYFFKVAKVEYDPWAAHEQYVAGLIKYSKPTDETLAVLTSLQQSHKLAIITNGLKEAQRPRLKNTGLDKFFTEVIVSDEIGVAKPQVEYFDYVINEIGHSQKDELLIIGDSLMSDILGGMNSCIDTVWYNPAGLATHSKVSPIYTIADLQELVRL